MKRQSKEFFPGIPQIQYEGPGSKNPLAFKHYNADELVEGKPMKEHLRFSVTYWHTIRGQLSDMFGAGTAVLGSILVSLPTDQLSTVLGLPLSLAEILRYRLTGY